MTTPKRLLVKLLTAGVALVAVPLAVLAHGPMGDMSEGCPPALHFVGPLPLPAGRMPDFAPPGAMPPFLRGVALTEAQEDKLFLLMHAGMPRVREQLRTAFKAMEELRDLAASDKFDAAKARTLAETQARAMAQVALMHSELDAKVRAMLTPGQRKQFDEARAKAESCGHFRPPL